MSEPNNSNRGIGALLDQVERYVVLTLLAAMLIVVIGSTIELLRVIFEMLLQPPQYLFLDIDELLPVFGFFLMVLIGLELLASIRMYLDDQTIHAELVMVVALIAVSRKIIVLDYYKTDPMTVFGIGVLVIALSAGYFLLKRSRMAEDKTG